MQHYGVTNLNKITLLIIKNYYWYHGLFSFLENTGSKIMTYNTIYRYIIEVYSIIIYTGNSSTNSFISCTLFKCKNNAKQIYFIDK